MIIVGDIASPSEKFSRNLGKLFENQAGLFSDNTLVFNLEGLITDVYSTDTDTPVLFNNSELLNVIKRNFKGAVAALANNHTLDLPHLFDTTQRQLDNANIPFTGAGKSSALAEDPIHFIDSGKDVYLFNFCWDFLLYHQKNPSNNVYVAEIQELKIIKKVKECRAANPDAAIVIYFHWSIDLEVLPYPMYRQFSRALIDQGANIVAGCHSHCVQGGEVYKNGYIVYGLGNFFIPWNVYAGGKLDFPAFSKPTLGLEWNPKTNEAVCHWFEYEKKSKSVKYIESESFKESARLLEYSPYQNMDNNEYEEYFRTHRRKGFLIPVFTDYRKIWYNKWLNFLIKKRARTARILAKFNLIKWQS